MPAVTESVYSIPSLTTDFLNGGISAIVPDDLYEEAIQPLFEELVKKGIDPNTPFDPERHLLFTDDYYEKTQRLTLKDLQQENPHQAPITEIGVSEPFPLFTDEAIDIMRYEVLAREAFQSCGRISEMSNTGDKDFYVRGCYTKYQPFTFAAWKHPKTLEIVSKMANVELVNMLDYETGYTNISVKTSHTTILDTTTVPVNVEDQDASEIKASVAWHYDSPQYVCVVMLSDTTQMTGGETALQTGNGNVAKVAGPKRGWANVLQGRVLKHIATKPKGNFVDRITSVASLRPKDPLKDNCFMTTIKPTALKGTRYNDFYRDWMNYRLGVLSERIAILQKNLEEDYQAGKYFDQIGTADFIQKNIVEYAERSYQEFEAVDDGLVPKPASYNAIQARWL